MAQLGAQNSKKGIPNYQSYFIFRFYTGVLSKEAQQDDPVKMSMVPELAILYLLCVAS